jgi:transcription initiation factor TFIIA small subunit
MANYQHYRGTILGRTLQDTLNDMKSQGTLTEQAATKVLSEFDRQINIALDRKVNKKVQFSGKLRSYRCFDNVWTLIFHDFVVKDSQQGQHNTTAPPAQLPRAGKVKIVAQS